MTQQYEPTNGRLRSALVAGLLCLALAVPAWGQGGVVLWGLDTEYGGPGVHGDIEVHEQVVRNLLRVCTRKVEHEGILVLGGDKNPSDDITTFWQQVSDDIGVPVTFANGESDVGSVVFDPYGLVVVVSRAAFNVSGGLSQDEHKALVRRRADFARFINSGGSVFGALSNFDRPFGYLADLSTRDQSYTQIDVVSLTGFNPIPKDPGSGALWHQVFVEDQIPGFLDVLAFVHGMEEPAAIGGCQVTVPPPCAGVDGGEVLCTTDGSGDFLYTFSVTNQTDRAVEHLFLLEPTPPVEVTPDYFDLSDDPICSPSRPGCDEEAGDNTAGPFEVRIHNAKPEEVISFLVSLTDRLLEGCCSVEHVVELPSCECGQIVSDLPICNLLFNPVRYRQEYRFTFENLQSQAVDTLLVAPSPGSDVTVTPNRFTGLGLSGVPSTSPAGRTTQTVTLTGPDAIGGREVCLRFRSHDPDQESCCSIIRCFTVGSCTREVAPWHFNTGFNQAAGRLVSPGQEDDDWKILSDGARLPARRVARPSPNWHDPLPESAWIALDGETGSSPLGSDVLRFERCFCLADRPAGASLDLELFADDSARVLLNGDPIGGPGGAFHADEPLRVHYDGVVGGSLFVPGENCLVVEVEDSGGVLTGLDAAGAVVAEGGACPSTP